MENQPVNPDVQPEVQAEAPAVPAAPAVGSPEYNASMAARGNAATGNVPEKFIAEDGSVNVEALAASYLELERGQSAPVEEAEAPVVEATPEEQIAAPVEEAVADGLDSLQIPETPEVEEAPADEAAAAMSDGDWEEMKGYIWKNGELSEGEAASLAARTGWDSNTVKQWALAQRAEVQSAFNQAADVVGGHDQLSSMLKWAAETLPREEQQAINAQLRQQGATEYVLLGVKARYDQANTSAPRESQEPAATPRRAVTAPSVSVEPLGFESHGQFQAARADVRFASDAVYREQVMQRMSATDWGNLPR